MKHRLWIPDLIRKELNPHPAGQVEHNVPEINGEKLMGMQHKYKETVLFFPMFFINSRISNNEV